MRYYLTFRKEGNLRFISHLDLMRLFQRVFKRAGYGIRYSEGFNPHPRMSFAQPLSLGYVGLAELLEFEVRDDAPLTALDVPEQLNALLPPGIAVTDCYEIPTAHNVKQESLSGRTVAGEYDLYLTVPEDWKESAERLTKAFLGQPSITAVKRIKKTGKDGEVEIRPQILSLTFCGRSLRTENVYGMTVPAGALHWTATLATGSKSNLNPEQVLQAFCRFSGLPFDRTVFRVVRRKLILDK